MHVAYVITNKIDGKQYVGITSRSIKVRWIEHRKPSYPGARLHAAIKMFGKDNFTIEEVACAFTKADLHQLEITLIDQLNTFYPNGYNASRANIPYETSVETRKKISDYVKAHPLGIRPGMCTKIPHRTVGNIEYKQCTSCKEYSPISNFASDKSYNRWDGLSQRCRACSKLKSSKRYKRHKQRLNEQRRLKKVANLSRAISYKGGSCSVCGLVHTPTLNESAFNFKHRNSESKKFAILSNAHWSFKRLIEELDKTYLICKNCLYDLTGSKKTK